MKVKTHCNIMGLCVKKYANHVIISKYIFFQELLAVLVQEHHVRHDLMATDAFLTIKIK